MLQEIPENISEDEAYYLDRIKNGPNAQLHEELMKHQERFTQRQLTFGIQPLFMGYEMSLDLASAIANDRFKKYREKFLGKSLYEQEKGRIWELIRGEFELPQSVDNLLRNADRAIAYYEKQRGMILEHADEFNATKAEGEADAEGYANWFYPELITAVEEVKEIITKLRDEGLLTDPEIKPFPCLNENEISRFSLHEISDGNRRGGMMEHIVTCDICWQKYDQFNRNNRRGVWEAEWNLPQGYAAYEITALLRDAHGTTAEKTVRAMIELPYYRNDEEFDETEFSGF